jgi:metal-responsive CopG/Arc/MetJ family transcriptional regulator
MSQTLTIPDTLYAQLENTARTRGLSSVEELIQQLFEAWQFRVDELRRRQEVVSRIDALRERLFATYGEMADSVELIRADRAR